MTRFQICIATLGMMLWACGVESSITTPTGSIEQQGANLQGANLQGANLQGANLQGMNLQGILVAGATLADAPLDHVRVERGEVVAEQGGATLRGTALVGAHFQAQARNTAVSPPATAVIQYRVAAIQSELAQYDPTATGHTFLYTLEQWVDDTASWQPACLADTDGRNAAIPLAAVWDDHGDRSESSAMFTFGCTTGVIAKCYRWGYRPWVTGYGDLTTMHWTCTRLARADYCGDGVPHTHDGTLINVWDTLPPPGPIQKHGLLPPTGMLFEAGWNTGGAVCLSRARWLLDKGGLLASLCPDRLIPPGLLGATVCDTALAVLGFDPNATMFNESCLNGSGLCPNGSGQ
jgi:ADYC domain/Pentapeptide repeats (8 copies)